MNSFALVPETLLLGFIIGDVITPFSLSDSLQTYTHFWLPESCSHDKSTAVFGEVAEGARGVLGALISTKREWQSLAGSTVGGGNSMRVKADTAVIYRAQSDSLTLLNTLTKQAKLQTTQTHKTGQYLSYSAALFLTHLFIWRPGFQQTLQWNYLAGSFIIWHSQQSFFCIH